MDVEAMATPETIIVDFVAKGDDEDTWKMVLVEGTWDMPVEHHLRLLQERLFICVDAALEGQLARKFPETTGKRIIIQVDCYEAPRTEVEDFFTRFATGIFSIPKYRDELEASSHVQDIRFEINFDVLDNLDTIH